MLVIGKWKQKDLNGKQFMFTFLLIFAGCRNKTFFNKATSLKLMNQFEPNLTGIVLCWSLFEKKYLIGPNSNQRSHHYKSKNFLIWSNCLYLEAESAYILNVRALLRDHPLYYVKKKLHEMYSCHPLIMVCSGEPLVSFFLYIYIYCCTYSCLNMHEIYHMLLDIKNQQWCWYYI